MPRIRTDKVVTYSDPKSQYSYTATPDMGVIAHFPSKVCAALVAKGAKYVTPKKPPKGKKADSAD